MPPVALGEFEARLFDVAVSEAESFSHFAQTESRKHSGRCPDTELTKCARVYQSWRITKCIISTRGVVSLCKRPAISNPCLPEVWPACYGIGTEEIGFMRRIRT